jgi:uncharacterized protein YcbK (DUF882 family)
MKASILSAPHRSLPLWLAPCVCLALMVLFPAKGESTPRTTAVSVAVVKAAPAAASEVPAAPPAPATVHVVLTRGPHRLELDLPVDGKVSPAMADDIARIMRCPTSGRTRRIAPGTLALLADVAARFPGHEIQVVSAVRDEPDRTRDGVKHSKHWDGHAIDLIVQGAKLTEVRDAMWKNHRDIGVGWYPTGGFIHLDYRPDVHDTAWTQQRPNADNQYNPRWSRVARDVSDDPAVLRAQMRRVLAASPMLSTLVTSIAEAMGYSTAGIVRDRRSS